MKVNVIIEYHAITELHKREKFKYFINIIREKCYNLIMPKVVLEHMEKQLVKLGLAFLAKKYREQLRTELGGKYNEDLCRNNRIKNTLRSSCNLRNREAEITCIAVQRSSAILVTEDPHVLENRHHISRHFRNIQIRTLDEFLY